MFRSRLRARNPIGGGSLRVCKSQRKVLRLTGHLSPEHGLFKLRRRAAQNHEPTTIGMFQIHDERLLVIYNQ